LYQVFELLLQLRPSLPGFGRANWQSTVRGFASAHPDYSDVQSWNGSEGSDMFYTDASGALTGLLVEKGYLDAAEWTGQTPEYHIEVKTTMMGGVETPFYVSKWQYSRVSDSFMASFSVASLTQCHGRCKTYISRRRGRSCMCCSGCTAWNRGGSDSSYSWTRRRRGAGGN
jgi:hypothetical protein